MAVKLDEFFRLERGISDETLAAFGVEIDGNKATFPYGTGEKTRVHDGESRKFFFTPGATPTLFHHPTPVGGDLAFLVEGESDTMRLWQVLAGLNDVYGLSGIEGWRDEMKDKLSRYSTVYVILDNDEDYNVQGRVETAWRNIRASLGPRATRLRLPKETKDVCEFFDVYDLDTLRLMAEVAPTQALHFEKLDLTVPPKPVNWLITDLIAQGDVVAMLGEPNVGKSFLSMALAVKVAGAGGTWLGHAVRKQGRVLYVDEENPQDVVHQRMAKLGLTKEYADNVRYLHHQGIRLDRFSDKMLDEAIAWAPTLIVLDSLTRLHTQDENNAGQVAKLFNDGINPLARETGATLLLLHHVNKTDSSSAFIRARGSSDFGASVDTGLDVRKAGGAKLHVVHYKSRRRQAGDVIQCEITDTPGGGIDIVTSAAPVF